MIRIIAGCSLKSHTSKVSLRKFSSRTFFAHLVSVLSVSKTYERSAVCIREKSKWRDPTLPPPLQSHSRNSPCTMLAKNTTGVASAEWVCIDLPGLLPEKSRQQVGGVVVASVHQLWWYLPLIKFLPQRASWEGVSGDKKLSEQSAVQQSIPSPAPSRAEPGRMDGRQVSHLGKLERSNKRAIAQPSTWGDRGALPPSFVVVVLQCFFGGGGGSSRSNLFSILWRLPLQ